MINMKEALQALRRLKTEVEISESQFGLVNDAAGVASLLVTRSGRVCEVNHMAAQMLGYQPHELEMRMLSDLLDASVSDQSEHMLSEWLARPATRVSLRQMLRPRITMVAPAAWITPSKPSSACTRGLVPEV